MQDSSVKTLSYNKNYSYEIHYVLDFHNLKQTRTIPEKIGLNSL